MFVDHVPDVLKVPAQLRDVRNDGGLRFNVLRSAVVFNRRYPEPAAALSKDRFTLWIALDFLASSYCPGDISVLRRHRD
ncbi:hypothetical protein FUT69_09125 [Xylella taiwanensis]|uniref:hypothetical protein n=1 Tax=Xylella taiwanensis TaxID=1444770 RepID=UPI0004BCEAE3|nr:hypothetical protein [Xylella taiwanensis]MCD8456335.1 hypothetical protein [Xylella taiwanensis]MCD8460879.1 hypothetical protein [Xylella taiwanensis]MCD8463062.1 hypothetical protein [Xylella taiwanensis]MCD8467057.1 hypothetical protein [Xylella taiwanensis]MCD8470608.1 hypothetical protein [Xylella taiwanensis]